MHEKSFITSRPGRIFRQHVITFLIIHYCQTTHGKNRHTHVTGEPLNQPGNIISYYENTPIQIYGKFHLQNQKTENFQIKNSDVFHISAQNIDCGYSLEPPRRGGSNEYPQSMFSSRNKKNNVYPCKPQFYYIKVGFKGVKII